MGGGSIRKGGISSESVHKHGARVVDAWKADALLLDETQQWSEEVAMEYNPLDVCGFCWDKITQILVLVANV